MKYRFFILLGLAVLGLFGADYARAATIGQVEDFFVDYYYDASSRDSIEAVLKYQGQYSYIYVEQNYWNNLDAHQRSQVEAIIKKTTQEFDQVIYPILTKTFGSEWNPGVDNDAKITILFTPLIEQAGGYVNTNDELVPKGFYRGLFSNQREMIYLNTNNFLDVRLPAYLAHEFQHLITFNQKAVKQGLSEDLWLNEAYSEIAPTICGYDDKFADSNLERRVNDFVKNPSDSLIGWQQQPIDYATASLFMHYLQERFGWELLQAMMRSQAVGLSSINAGLSVLQKQTTFNQIFTDWTMANWLQNCIMGDSHQYCYLQKPDQAKQALIISATKVYQLSGQASFYNLRSTANWAGLWYELRALDTAPADFDLRLTFDGSGPQGAFKLPYVLIDKQGGQEVLLLNLVNQRGLLELEDFAQNFQSLVLFPSNQFMTGASDVSENRATYSVQIDFGELGALQVDSEENDLGVEQRASRASEAPAVPVEKPAAKYPDGSLLRAQGTSRVYIIQNGYKRWLRAADIINFYGHLGWDKIIEVELTELDLYKNSDLLRSANDQKVYQLDANGHKHWLNMSASEFESKGYQWSSVFLINELEKNFYQAGVDILG